MAKKIINIFLVFAIVVFLGCTSKAGEIYTAEARGYYENPINGQIEDPGNNPGIGDGMVSNSVYALALIEKDDNGKLYATVRYKLRDQISDIRMWVQDKGSDSFTEVPVEETKNSGKTGDFRFEIPSTEALIKSSFFVKPMGRSVIFFVTLGNLQQGNTDFKAYVSTSSENDDNGNGKNSNINEPKKRDDAETPKVAVGINNSKTGEKTINNKNSRLGKEPDNSTKTVNRNLPENKTEKKNFGFSHGLLTNKDFGDEQKSIVKNEKKPPLGPISKAFLMLLIVILGILISALIIGAAVILILYKKIKDKNEKIESYIEKKKNRENISNEESKKIGRSDLIMKEKNTDEYDEKHLYKENPECENTKKVSKGINSQIKDESIWDRHPGFLEEEENNDKQSK